MKKLFVMGLMLALPLLAKAQVTENRQIEGVLVKSERFGVYELKSEESHFACGVEIRQVFDVQVEFGCGSGAMIGKLNQAVGKRVRLSGQIVQAGGRAEMTSDGVYELHHPFDLAFGMGAIQILGDGPSLDDGAP